MSGNRRPRDARPVGKQTPSPQARGNGGAHPIPGAHPIRRGSSSGPAGPLGELLTIRQDVVIRRTTYAILVLGTILGALVLAGVVLGGASPVDLLVAGLVAGLAALTVVNRRALNDRERRRSEELADTARIIQGLSRAVSPDAVVAAIADELGSATGADHVVVVRRRPSTWTLDATLVSMRPGVPPSTTMLPATDLVAAWRDDADGPREPISIVAGSAGRSFALGAGVPAPARAPEAGVRAPGALMRFRAVPDDVPGDGDVSSPAARASIRRIEARVADAFGLSHTIAAPLEVATGLVGAIVLSRRTSQPWTDSAQRHLALSAAEASAALDRVYSLRDAEARAATDPLTGLPNRRYFDEYLHLLARRRRAGDRVGVLMIDLDHFKRLNDEHGHPAGDRVLVEVARAMVATVRDVDLPARVGGEEFAVLLRDPAPGTAAEIGERVRAAIAEIDLAADGLPGVTASVGVAVADSADEPIEEIVERADQALLAAKRAGRDRVQVS